MHRPTLTALTCACTLMAAAAASAQDAASDAGSPSYMIGYEVRPTDPEVGRAEHDLLTAAYAELLASHVESVVGARGEVSQSGLRSVVVVLEECSPEEIESVVRGLPSGLSGLCFVADEDVDMDAARDGLARRLTEHTGQSPSQVDVTDLAWVAGSTQYRWVALSDTVLSERREGILDFENKPLEPDDYALLVLDASGTPLFSPHDFQSVTLTEDQRGNRAVGIKMKDARAEAFGGFTEAGIGRRLAIVVDGRVWSQPASVMDRLSDYFVIMSGELDGFTRDEVMDTLVRLQLAGGLLQVQVVEEGPSAPIRIKQVRRVREPGLGRET